MATTSNQSATLIHREREDMGRDADEAIGYDQDAAAAAEASTGLATGEQSPVEADMTSISRWDQWQQQSPAPPLPVTPPPLRQGRDPAITPSRQQTRVGHSKSNSSRCAAPTSSPNPRSCRAADYCAGVEVEVESSSQQEPGSAKYLARLLRLATREASLDTTPSPSPVAPLRSPPPQRRQQQEQTPTRTLPGTISLMADFLASFGLASDNQAPSQSGQCSSIDNLASRLRAELDQNITETRVHHVAVNIELRNTARFSLGLSSAENEVLETLGVGRLTANEARMTEPGEDDAGENLMTRDVSANDALMRQSDDPAFQRTVAKHIIGAISTTDNSNWTLRDLSRGAQGWVVTYICRDSLQYWTRQNAKNPTAAIIGEYSQREPDPILLGRTGPHETTLDVIVTRD